MKALNFGCYTLTIEQVYSRYWFTISLGKLPLCRKHERSLHKATMKGLEKLESIVNI